MIPEIVIKLVRFYKGKLTQKKVLEALGVSRTTYNKWIKKTPINKEDSELEALVRSLCIENKYRYGYRKITHLVNQKIKANKNTIQKIMQNIYQVLWICITERLLHIQLVMNKI